MLGDLGHRLAASSLDLVVFERIWPRPLAIADERAWDLLEDTDVYLYWPQQQNTEFMNPFGR